MRREIGVPLLPGLVLLVVVSFLFGHVFHAGAAVPTPVHQAMAAGAGEPSDGENPADGHRHHWSARHHPIHGLTCLARMPATPVGPVGPNTVDVSLPQAPPAASLVRLPEAADTLTPPLFLLYASLLI